MIPRHSLVGAVMAALVIAATLRAQPDPVLSCRERASALIDAALDDISGQRRGGDDVILWKAKLPGGQVLSGFCEANPRTGRIVMLGTHQDPGGINRAFPMTPDDAERVCQREARARFSPGNGMVYATFLVNTSTKSIYRVEWRYPSTAGTIRKGRCEIDSATGRIRKFDVSSVW